jgi:proline iminopeptidase
MTMQNMAQDSTGIVEVDGAQLRYRIEGHGPPCLVIGSSVFYPRMFSQELRDHLQLVFADLRHFADPRHFASSDPSFRPEAISVETYADDVERVRQTLGLGDVVVIGHSIHAIIALEYARRYPEHMRGVVMLGAAPGEDLAEVERLWEAEASEERKEILARQLAELTPEVRATLSPADIFVREYVANGPRWWHDPTRDASWLWEEVVPDMPVLGRLGELLEIYDLASEAAEITIPALIAAGRYDYYNPYTLWEENRHNLLPRHAYVLFERSGHFPPLEEPQRFDQTLLTWMHGIEGSDS